MLKERNPNLKWFSAYDSVSGISTMRLIALGSNNFNEPIATEAKMIRLAKEMEDEIKNLILPFEPPFDINNVRWECSAIMS
jgi:hypothetical protein